ncbi:MAG: hypothetical protein ACE5Z5_09515 [Candidatus Bathyarchaeia archaeon]
MPNLTVSIPKDLYERMKRRRDVRWSEVVRRAIREHLDRLELGGVAETRGLMKIIGEAGVSLEEISVDKAVEHYKRMRELEWKRLSTTRAS